MRALGVVFAAVLICVPAQAQRVNLYDILFPRADSIAHPALVRGPRFAIEDMRTALRNLITAEERYWNDHGTYATDGSALGIYPTSKGQPSVQVIFAGSRGWTGMATDQSLKGKSCVVYVGNEQELPGGLPKTMAAGIVATGEGVPTCDQP
jgi:hypothetical protein